MNKFARIQTSMNYPSAAVTSRCNMNYMYYEYKQSTDDRLGNTKRDRK